jgi:hypothetical protein
MITVELLRPMHSVAMEANTGVTIVVDAPIAIVEAPFWSYNGSLQSPESCFHARVVLRVRLT